MHVTKLGRPVVETVGGVAGPDGGGSGDLLLLHLLDRFFLLRSGHSRGVDAGQDRVGVLAFEVRLGVHGALVGSARGEQLLAEFVLVATRDLEGNFFDPLVGQLENPGDLHVHDVERALGREADRALGEAPRGQVLDRVQLVRRKLIDADVRIPLSGKEEQRRIDIKEGGHQSVGRSHPLSLEDLAQLAHVPKAKFPLAHHAGAYGEDAGCVAEGQHLRGLSALVGGGEGRGRRRGSPGVVNFDGVVLARRVQGGTVVRPGRRGHSVGVGRVRQGHRRGLEVDDGERRRPSDRRNVGGRRVVGEGSGFGY
mmetsp:Transcript_7658/g.13833  ORF Transcript_7658/g.13833 Transcript_7658/m.13833 type:complete len:310 (+) Transcript_7658:1498-2427(+)